MKIYSASFSQSNIYLTEKLHKIWDSYHIPLMFEIEGMVDKIALDLSFSIIMERHEMLRSSFFYEKNKVYQSLNSCEIVSEFVEITGNCTPEIIKIEKIINEFIKEKFTLNMPPLIRFLLIKKATDKYFIVICAHHLIFDGLSEGIFISELANVYSSLVNNEEIRLPKINFEISKYINDQERMVHSGEMERQEKYLWSQLRNVDFLLVKKESSKGEGNSLIGQSKEIVLYGDIVKKIRKFQRSNNVTMYTFLLSSFHILLHILSGGKCIATVSPFSGRNSAYTRMAVGNFVNMVPIVSTIDLSESLISYLSRISNIVIDAQDNQDVPISWLLEKLNRSNSWGANFSELVSFSYASIQSNDYKFHGLKVSRRAVGGNISKFSLSVTVIDMLDDGLRIRVSYRPGLYDESWIKRFLELYQKVICYKIDNGKDKLGSLVSHRSFNTDRNTGIFNIEKIISVNPTSKKESIHGNDVIYNKKLEFLVNEISEYLGLKPNEIVPEYSFREIGGTSLLVLKIFSKIEKIGWSCKLESFYTAKSLYEIAGMIDVGNSEILSKIPNGVFLIRSGSPCSNGVLFIIHPVSGEISCYSALLSHIELNVTMFGVSFDSCMVREDIDLTITEIAESYVSKIKELKGSRPCYLLGWSIGGLVALEISRLLEVQKDPVSYLGLIDTHCISSMNYNCENICGSGDDYKKLLAYEAEKKNNLCSHLAREKFEIEEISVNTKVLSAAARAYVPSWYPREINMYAAENSLRITKDLGWGDKLNNFNLYVIQGDHNSIVLEPDKFLALLLTKHIEGMFAPNNRNEINKE